MKKKADHPKLKTVDEDPVGQDFPPVLRTVDKIVARQNLNLIHDSQDAEGKGAGDEEKMRLEIKDKSELVYRTHDAKMEERVEKGEVSPEDEWNTKKERSKGGNKVWISIVVILLVGMGWLGVEISLLNKPEVTKVKNPSDPKVVINHQEVRIVEEANELNARLTISTIRAVVADFYKAGSVDEMSKLVRHSERVKPLMENYYSNKQWQSSEVISVVGLNPLTIGNRGGFWVVLTKLASGEDGKLVVEVTGSEDAKVDWETYICYQPMNWEQFIRDRPADYHGDFRVYVERDDFYNYEFADSKKYQAFRLTTLNSEEVLFGYAPRDEEIARKIDELLTKNNNQKLPMMLKLYRQENLQSKSGVLIEKIVAPRWLLVDSPEVEK